MRIMILAQHFAPEEVSGAVLATELAIDLVQRGHEVSFVTCAPNYPDGKVFAGYRNRLYRVEQMEGVHVVRTWSYISPDKGFWSRILNYGTFSASALYGALLAGRPQIMMSYSPPLPLGVTAWLLSWWWKVPWVLRVEDLYPEAAVATGILRNRLAISFFFWLEKFLYDKATHISLISDGFRQNLIKKDVPADKLSVAPVWSDPAVQPGQKDNFFRQAHGLQGQFVVMYAGNLGYTSAIEDVLEAAIDLKENPAISFVIIGEGVKKQELQSYAQERGLSQVLFLPYQPREMFPEVMASADISLVTLNEKSANFSLPSKLFSIMTSGRPIIAVAPLESEIATVVRAADCGIVVPPGMPKILVDEIQRLSSEQSQLDIMGFNGREYLTAHNSKKVCLDLYEATLNKVLA